MRGRRGFCRISLDDVLSPGSEARARRAEELCRLSKSDQRRRRLAGTSPEDNVEANEASSRVEDALGELTDVQRQVLRLLREELSENEIAAKLGIPLSQVKNSKRLARMKLARKLKIDPEATNEGEGGDAPAP